MRKAFTLIELLIVIAIIAILALIAIPNFLEAQIRAKVSKATADLRSMATGIEAYFVDNNAYPIAPGNYNGSDKNEFCTVFQRDLNTFTTLRTPIMYIDNESRNVIDPFYAEYNGGDGGYTFSNLAGAVRHLKGHGVDNPNWSNTGGNKVIPALLNLPVPLRFNGSKGAEYYSNWILTSKGPDKDGKDPRNDNPSKTINAETWTKDQGGWDAMTGGTTDMYDPSNGTMSRGNIWRFSCSAQVK